MFKIPRSDPWPPTLDLATIKDTLIYMRDDMRRVPGMERIADALDEAVVEITVAEESQPPRLKAPQAITPRFVAWQPKRDSNA